MIRQGALAAGRDGSHKSLYSASEPEAMALMQQLRDLQLDDVIRKVFQRGGARGAGGAGEVCGRVCVSG